MWARKRIDIRTRDLVAALGSCFSPPSASSSLARLSRCFDSDQLFACLSVRSGFDLLLSTTNWRTGSEVIFSGLTIGDMPRIANQHAIRVVGTDVDWRTLTPSAEAIEDRITPQTRAIVVAHLMGGRADLNDIADVARRHNLMLIEDCAQSYVGNQYLGSPLADVSMFSFGSIKTNTALGGAIFVVRDRKLKLGMQARHAIWPIQSSASYFKRIMKYGMVKTISTWPIAAMIRIGFKALGSNHDAMAAQMAKGFAGPNFFARIRHRPSDALMDVLARRIETFDPNSILRRHLRGESLSRAIADSNDQIRPLGCASHNSTHWVFAVLVKNPKELAQKLWSLGFDATTHSSLKAIESVFLSADTSGTPQKVAQPLEGSENILRQLVFLPLDAPMPERELIRLGKAVGKWGQSLVHPVAETEFAKPYRDYLKNSSINV